MNSEEKDKLGLVHIITGNGKGKTTSGMGMAVRALGRGLRVKIVQLFKRDTGEQYFFEKLKTNPDFKIAYVQFQPLHPFFKKYTPENFESLKKDLKEFWDSTMNDLENYDLLMIDEVGPGLNWKVLDESMVLDMLAHKPPHLEVIMTGRDYPASLKERVDYVSEVQLIKHPYEKKILARKGVEY
jgi:cob(I)alamin adenosyltransferase